MSHPDEESKEQLDKMAEEMKTEVNVQVKQMLTVEPKYCTRIRHTNSIKFPVPLITPIEREDIPVQDARVFLLHDLLTPAECAHYIRETEEICYRDLRSEFEESYRSNERLLVLSETLADYLWRRMQPHLHRNDVIRVRPMCFGNGGSWLPHRLNECFKFGKYQKKQHFGSHIDGPWVPRSDESSIYTVLIYLNDNFEGGETVFTPPTERTKLDQQIAATRELVEAGLKNLILTSSEAASISEPNGGYVIDPSTGRVTIQPRQGTALIFTHDTLHAGLPVLSGTKYVLRTEIMFSRHDSESIPASIREAYHTDPNYQQTVTLYLDSYAKSKKGDVTGFTNSYLAALKLQHEAQFSVSKDTKAIHELNLPLSLYVHLFTFLNVKDLVRALQCSKSFRDIGRDGTLWKQLYRTQFPVQATIEAQIQQQQRLKLQHRTTPANESIRASTTASVPRASSESQITFAPIKTPNDSSKYDFGLIDPAIQDWYTIFKQRVFLEKEFVPVIIDFGSFTTKCSLMTPPDTPVLELLNLVAVVDGMHDLHCRRGAWERYYVGLSVSDGGDDEARKRYRLAKHVFVEGQPTEKALVGEVVMACLLKLGIWSHKHPLIIAEPPFGWNEHQRSQLSAALQEIFHLPALCFVNSAMLTLMSQNLDSGIVAHVGHDTAWVAGIYQRRMLAFYDFTPNMESPNAKFNSTWEARREGTEGILPDGTLTSQNQVTPEELAIRTADVYHDMLAQINDAAQQTSTPFHQIVLCGGSTISDDFRLKYQACITTANSTRRHSDIGVIRERMLQQAGLSSSGVASVTPTNYIHDLTIILPTHPTHTVVEGGKIFGGLSFFKDHCIRAFELSNSTSDGGRSRGYETSTYKPLWSPYQFLEEQHTYELIKNHFHREDEFDGDYIANTSCSDHEVEHICATIAEQNAQRLDDPVVKPPLVWRRRRKNAKARGIYTPLKPSSDDAATRKKVAELKKSLPLAKGAPLPPDPNYPLRRTRRSAFPILPKPVAEWFEQQSYLRALPPKRTPYVSSQQPPSTREQEERKDGVAEDANPSVEDEGVDLGWIDPTGTFPLKNDMWCPWDPETKVGSMTGNYQASQFLASIRKTFGDQKTEPSDRSKRWEWMIAMCEPTKRRPILSDDDEEGEVYTDEEEFVEEPPHLAKFKLDHFKALRSSRLATRAFVMHATVPSLGGTSLGQLECHVDLIHSIPDGSGGTTSIAHSLDAVKTNATGRYWYPASGFLHFSTIPVGNHLQLVAFMVYDAVVVQLGICVHFTDKTPFEVIKFDKDGSYICFYLTTRSLVNTDDRTERMFLVQLGWRNKLDSPQIKDMYEKAIAHVHKSNAAGKKK